MFNFSFLLLYLYDVHFVRQNHTLLALQKVSWKGIRHGEISLLLGIWARYY